MTPAILFANLALSIAGLGALCLSLSRHHGQVLTVSPGPTRTLVLRAAGWVVLALSFAVAALGEGWVFGPIQWIGAVTAGAVALVVALSYRPQAIPWLMAGATLSAIPALIVAAS